MLDNDIVDSLRIIADGAWKSAYVSHTVLGLPHLYEMISEDSIGYILTLAIPERFACLVCRSPGEGEEIQAVSHVLRG